MLSGIGRAVGRTGDYSGESEHEQPVLVVWGAAGPAGHGERVDEAEEIADVDVGANGSGSDRASEEGLPGGGDHRVAGLEAAAGFVVLVGGHGGGQPVVHRRPRIDQPEPRDQCLRRVMIGGQRLRGVAELSHVIGVDRLQQVLAGREMPVQRCPCRKPHPRSSRRMLILMEHSAQSVASSYVKAGQLAWRCQWHGQWLERAGVRDALVRPVPVVELLELPQGASTRGG